MLPVSTRLIRPRVMDRRALACQYGLLQRSARRQNQLSDRVPANTVMGIASKKLQIGLIPGNPRNLRAATNSICRRCIVCAAGSSVTFDLSCIWRSETVHRPRAHREQGEYGGSGGISSLVVNFLPH
jgi:hypothetical protein